MAKILSEPCGAETEVKKSRFLSRLISVENVPDVKKIVQNARAEHPGACHVCYAYILQNGQSGSNDDGEPHGTAGRPLLEILRHNDLVNICVVVIRYFGGTLLGKGGLARAYRDAAKKALAEARIKDCVETEYREYFLSYAQYEKIKNFLKSEEIRYESQFTNEVQIQIWAEQNVCLKLDEKVKNLQIS